MTEKLMKDMTCLIFLIRLSSTWFKKNSSYHVNYEVGVSKQHSTKYGNHNLETGAKNFDKESHESQVGHCFYGNCLLF